MTRITKRQFSAYALWFAIPLLTVITQACTKLLAVKMQAVPFGWVWLQTALTTPWIAGIFLCEAIGFLLWLTILSGTGISKAMPITATVYLLILGLSWTYFHESMQLLQIIGSALILAGVWLIGTAPNDISPGPLAVNNESPSFLAVFMRSSLE